MKRFILFALTLLLISFNANAILIGMVVPMPSEARYACNHAFDGCENPTKINRVLFYKGKIGGYPAVLARSGIGLVNPTITTSTMINRFHPDILILIGSSGGITSQNAGDVVIGKHVFNYEFGTPNRKNHDYPNYPKNELVDIVNPNNQKLEPLVLGTSTHVALQKAAQATVHYFKKHANSLPTIPGAKQPIVSAGTIADSTVFFTPDNMTEDMKAHGVTAIAFEDIAFLQTCWFYNARCVAIRGVSNPLPVMKGNPGGTASAAGRNAFIVANRYVRELYSES